MKKTVLMVDDARNFCEHTRGRVASLDPEIAFLMAHSLGEAKEAFQRHKSDLDLIVMDGKLDGTVEETCRLVEELRCAGFTAPIIAASCMYNYKLIAAGCTIDGDVNNLASEIIKAVSQ